MMSAMNKRRLADEESNRETTRATKKRLVTNTHDGSPRKVQVIRISSSLPDRMLYHGVKTDVSPEMKIEQILLASNLDVDWTSYMETDFFLPPTQDEIEAYDFDILNAVRAQDMATLRRFRKDGRPLKCSNKFGESILHLACRKGFVEVTRFLVQEAGVPLAVCDDYGRSPLHDACWRRHDGRTFELIDIILQKCPDLLYVRDKRGNSPLSYVRREDWGKWNEYLLRKKASVLTPKLFDFKKIQACNHHPRAA